MILLYSYYLSLYRPHEVLTAWGVTVRVTINSFFFWIISRAICAFHIGRRAVACSFHALCTSEACLATEISTFPFSPYAVDFEKNKNICDC